jgi:hypothetical protein
MSSKHASNNADACVESGEWTPVPTSFVLSLQDVYAASTAYYPTWQASTKMAFHMIGCSGNEQDLTPQQRVADAMVAQIAAPNTPPGVQSQPVAPGWMFHLGDITYTFTDGSEGTDQTYLYNQLFYGPYTEYKLPIVAIPGNHDSKNTNTNPEIEHFLLNFCAASPIDQTDNSTDDRPAMTQPYPYFVLQTPVATIIGLFTNVQNGGVLDDPMAYNGTSTSGYTTGPQYQWLVRQLKAYGGKGLPVLLALHYPPYSGATDFTQRADPNLAPEVNPPNPNPTLLPIGMILQQAIADSGVYPDAVFSAHAHLYERLTYTTAAGREIPCLIVGSSGHSAVEQLSADCAGDYGTDVAPPLPLTEVPYLTLPTNDTVSVVNYNDRDFGFLRVTVDTTANTLTGEFFTAYYEPQTTHNTYPAQPQTPPAFPLLYDWFTLDLANHTLIAPTYSV